MKDLFKSFREKYGRYIHPKLAAVSLLGVLLILLGNLLGAPEENTTHRQAPPEKNETEPSPSAGRREETELEDKLQAILSKVKGAGRVEISVSLSGGTVKKYEKNIVKETKVTEEKGAQGVTRTTNEVKENMQILTNREKGEEKPVVVTEEKPVVRGIIIVADGAGDSKVKEHLLRAAQAGLDVSANKITVLPRGR